MPGRSAVVVLVIALYTAIGLVAIVQSEQPKGRASFLMVSSYTGAPIPHATVNLASGDRYKTYTSDQHGRIPGRTLPAGSWRVSAYSRAHSAENETVTIAEGEAHQFVVTMKPNRPFLNLIHPQSVYLPDEEIKIALQGFDANANEIEIELLKVDWSAVPAGNKRGIMSRLEGLRYGWWQGGEELARYRQRMGQQMKLVASTRSAIENRDAEGVFLEYAPISPQGPGVYAAVVRAGAQRSIALIIVTSVGLVVKSAPNQTMVWTTDLKTGRPIANVPIEVYGDESALSASTNAQGLAALDAKKTTGNLLAVALDPSTRAPTAWARVYRYDEGGRSGGLSGAIYSDRPVYRAGHIVRFKGVLRNHTPNGYTVPGGQPARVKIRNGENDLIFDQSVRLSQTGSFNAQVKLSAEAGSGLYSMTAETDTGQASGEFMVSQYRKPSIEVKVRPSKPFFVGREAPRWDIEAGYYFGLPVANAEIQYSVYRSRVYAFGEDEMLDEYEGEYYGEYVGDGTTRTDDAGKATVHFDWGWAKKEEESDSYWDQPGDYEYKLVAYITGEGYEYASGEGKALATQGLWTVGIESSLYYGGLNSEFEFGAVATDRASGEEREASAVWRAGVVNWDSDKTTVDWRLQGSGDVWRQRFDRPGEWLIEANVRDDQGNPIKARQWIYVSDRAGADAPPVRDALKVILDKANYAVGEKAKLLVRSRVKEGWVLVSVEGDRIHRAQALQISRGQAELEIPITAAFTPSAYVSVCMTANKRFFSRSAPIRIGSEDKKLTIEVESDKPKYEPRERARLRFRATANGQPVQAEISVAVVDEAIFAIRRDKPETLFNSLYARRPNQVSTEHSFPWLALQGDKSGSESPRRYFPDTAMWLPTITTDAQGRAHAELVVPDSLTEWRVTAIGHTARTEVGHGIGRFKCSRPFAVRLSAPLVWVEGDEALISVVASNDSDQRQEGEVWLEGGIKADRKRVSIEPGATAAVSWRHKADKMGNLEIVARGETRDGKRDSEAKTIEILPFATYRSQSARTTLQSGENVVRLSLDPRLIPEYSRLELRIAPTILSQIIGSLDYLVDYPYGCTEQTMSRFLPSLMAGRLMQEQGLAEPIVMKRARESVAQSISRLYRFQNYSGGWGWWEEGESDPWMTAYVLRGLWLAEQYGQNIDEKRLDRARDHLTRSLTSAYSDYRPRTPDQVAFALFALAESGAPMPTLAFQVGENRDRIVLLNKAEDYSAMGMAHLYMALKKWGAESVMPGLLDKMMLLSEGNHWPVRHNDYWTTAAEQTAWVYLALSRAGIDGARLTEIASWLSRQRMADEWGSTKATAAVMEALLDHARRFRVSAAAVRSVSISVTGSSPINVAIDANPALETLVSLDPRNLRAGANEIKINVTGPPGAIGIVNVRQAIKIQEIEGEVIGGASIKRDYMLLESLSGGAEAVGRSLRSGDRVRAGSLIKVKLTLRSADAKNWQRLLIEDPVLSGCRPIDAELPRSGYSDSASWSQEMRDDRMLFAINYSWGDEISVEYVLRAETPGEFRALPPIAWTMYGDGRATGLPFRLGVRE